MADAKIVISAQDQATGVLNKVEGSLGSLQGIASKVSGALGLVGIAGVAGLVAMSRAVVDGVDRLNDLKDATGASVENISALEDTAARTGTSMDTVSTALVKFNAALKDAKPDSDAAAAFNAIGLSVKELKDLDPAEALLKTAQALSGFADDGNKARLTQELFGKSLKEVAPFLKDLAEKGELVAKVTTKQAEEAEKFNKELFNLAKNSEDARRAMVGPLVEAINLTIEKFRLGTIAGKSFYTTLYEEQLRLIGLNDGPKEYADRLSKVNAALSKGEPRLLVRNALLREQAQLQAKLNAGPDFSPDNQSAAEMKRLGRKVSVDFSGKGKPDNSAEQLARKQEAAVQGLREQLIGATEDTGEFDKVMERLTSGAWKDFSADARAATLALAGEIDQQKQATELKKQATKSYEDASRESRTYLDSLVREQQKQDEATKTLRQQVEEIGLNTEALNKLRLARLDATLATVEQDRALQSLQTSSQAELDTLDAKIIALREQRRLTASGQVAQANADSKDKADKASKDFADTLNNDLKGAFSNAFRDTSGNALQSFGDALANVIYTRSATALAESLIQSAGGTAEGSILAKIFGSFDGGGYTGNGARSGGLDGKGGFMAIMHPQETVTDHTKTGNAPSQQAVTVVQNFTVGDVASVSLVRQAVSGSERRIAAAMGRSMTYGGALS